MLDKQGTGIPALVEEETTLAKLLLNELNVNNVLNEIRPYIEAAGGYLEFVSIDYLEEGPVVFVKLLGACSSCAMSSMPLKQAIQTALQAQWPEITQVIQV